MLAPDIRRELRSLSKETADRVARHLVAAGRTLDEDPATALAHARAARAYGGRIGVVREATGVAAYAAGEWQEALAELRAARRMTGSNDYLPLMADCERALGRPERALELYRSAAAATLDAEGRAELLIVASGARRDLGQPHAAAVMLQDAGVVSERDRRRPHPWSPRLWYAYAEALLEDGRRDEAREWLAAVAEQDLDGGTDAGERLLEIDGIVFASEENVLEDRQD